MGKLSQYRRQFRNEWTVDKLLEDWIVRVDEDDSIARCKFCYTVLPAHYAGLCNHARSSLHVRNQNFPIKHEPESEQDCMLDLQVFASQSTQSIDETRKPSTTDTVAVDSSLAQNPVACTIEQLNRLAPVNMCQQSQSVKDSSKRTYRHKFSAKWSSDSSLNDWLRPVAGDVYHAMCTWCDSILPAHLPQLREHSTNEMHVQKGLVTVGSVSLESKDREHPNENALSTSELVLKNVKKRGRVACNQSSEEDINGSDDDEHEKQHRIGSTSQFYITASKGDCSDISSRKRQIKQAGCYVLSRSQWDRYRQKYRQKWESDPLFQGWLAPVESDVYKARCLYCRMMFRAHSKDLKDHARTSKHATNVAFGMPCSFSELSEPAPNRNVMWRKRALQSKHCSRFERSVKSEPLAVVRQGPIDSYASAGLLEPDETLATHESLVSAALNAPSCKPTSNITTLVMPDPTKSLDEFISSNLPRIEDDDAYQILRVMKVLPKKEKDSSSAETSGASGYARTMTLWEFLKRKFESRQSISSASFLASILSEVEMLQHHLRRTVRDQLAAVPSNTDNPQAASNILVIQSEEMAQFLDIETGKYFIRDSEEQVIRQHQRSTDCGSVSRRGRRPKLAAVNSHNPAPPSISNEASFYDTSQQSMIGLDSDMSSYIMASQQVVQYEHELTHDPTIDQISTDFNTIDSDSVVASLKYGEPVDETNQVMDCSETYVGQNSSDDGLLVLYVTQSQEQEGCSLSPSTLHVHSSAVDGLSHDHSVDEHNFL